MIRGNSAQHGGGLAFLDDSMLSVILAPVSFLVRPANGSESLSADPFDAGTVLHCTIFSNTGEEGGGIYAASNTLSSVVNSIIQMNASPQSDFVHFGVSNTYHVCCVSTQVLGYENIIADAKLSPAGRPIASSPCIDAGFDVGLSTDCDSEARWDHPDHSNTWSVVDIGADEFVDADLDHMADHWETETLGGTTNSNGTADDDNDELDDLGEYENGTDPGDADSDADQMPDGWEVGNALDPLSDDAGEDPDSDAMGNRGEYVADTDPRNPDSVLRVTGVATELGGIRIDWKGGRQAWQFLECRGDLTTNASWTPILAIPPPTPLTNAIIDFGNSDRTLFYRIRAER